LAALLSNELGFAIQITSVIWIRFFFALQIPRKDFVDWKTIRLPQSKGAQNPISALRVKLLKNVEDAICLLGRKWNAFLPLLARFQTETRGGQAKLGQSK